jgi:hypothetical protein
MAKPIQLTVTLTLDEERLYDIIENCEVKPSQAKVKKLIKLFQEVECDSHEAMEEALEEFLNELVYEEWGE